MYILLTWLNTVFGSSSNWEFFSLLNDGWLTMEFTFRYDANPSEEDEWEWMYLNAERVVLPAVDFDALYKKLVEDKEQA